MMAFWQLATAAMALAAAASARPLPSSTSRPKVDSTCAADEFCCGTQCTPIRLQPVVLCAAVVGGCSRDSAPVPLGELPSVSDSPQGAPSSVLVDPVEVPSEAPLPSDERLAGPSQTQPDGCAADEFCCGFTCEPLEKSGSIPCLLIFGGCLMRDQGPEPMTASGPQSSGASPLGGTDPDEAPAAPPQSGTGASAGSSDARDDCCARGTFCCGESCIDDSLAPIVRCAFVEGGCCSAAPMDDDAMTAGMGAGGYGDGPGSGTYALP